MTIDSIDAENGLSWWLESEDARIMQRRLEEKIVEALFSQDPSSPGFQKMAAQLAWIGSQPERKYFLEREIAALNFSNGYEECGLWKGLGKTCRKVGHFIADHAVEIAVGTAICATGIGIAVATGYALSAAAGGVVVAGAGSIFQSEKKPGLCRPLPDPKACSQTELAAIQQGLSSSSPKIDLPSSVDEILITAGGIWANGQFFSTEGIMKHSMFASGFEKSFYQGGVDFQGSDWKLFYTYLSGKQAVDVPYQMRGEDALVLGNYHQAVHDLGRAIAINPADSLSYLERGAAHFELGEYDQSLEDYQRFTSQVQTTVSYPEFCLGFAKGLPKGVYESGKGALLFLVDFVKHPIQTSKQAFNSVSTLVDLVRRDEWGSIAEALAPEVHQLIMQWDTLPSDRRGELVGYVIGKHGADILLPGALAKVASKSVKSAEELVAVCKNFQLTQETLLLEAAAGIGNGVKIAEVIEASRKTTSLAEELGFTAREVGQLKQAGKLETTIAKRAEHLSPLMQESIALHKKAQDVLSPYVKKPMPEFKVRELIHETGIPTFPRPKGIPEDFLVMVTDKGAGMEYVHPGSTHIRVRVMPGKPHSPNPSQQKPYVIHQDSRGTFDKHGNKVNKNAIEAHIPIDEFIWMDSYVY